MPGEKGTYTREIGDDGVETLVLTPEKKPTTPEFNPPINIIEALPTNENATYPFPDWNRPLTQIKWITIHHSAGSRDTQNIDWWHYYHTQSKSWSRVGYHFGVAAWHPGDDIRLYQMNYLKTHSWHDSRNYDTIGICMAGDLRSGHDVRPNEIQVDLMGQWFAWVIPQLPELFAIVGHRRWQSTACPGDMEVWMSDLVESAAKYGVDIEPLVSERRASVIERATSFAIAFGRNVPSGDDYLEESGLMDF